MKLSIYGTGYVGLVTGVCLAELGHHVCCMDVDASKIRNLQQGIPPIYEEGLEALLQRNQEAGRITFTDDLAAAVAHGPVQMIAVGTPPGSDGSADLQYVDAVASSIAERMTDFRLIINKSTVPVGTVVRVESIVRRQLAQRSIDIPFAVASNPEFLREGRAIDDFLKPDRIVVGVQDTRSRELIEVLYAPLTEKGCELIIVDPASSELSKYAANAFLATKISFMNEVGQLADRYGADVEKIKHVLGADERISSQFLNAGCGFGGSCFPKDVLAMQHMARAKNYEPLMLNAVLNTNERQQAELFQKLEKFFEGNLSDKTIAVWGLAFKPDTDDIRSASSLVLLESLWNAGARAQAFDPLAMDNIKQKYSEQPLLNLCRNKEEALSGADALVIVTEWNDFKNPSLELLKTNLKHPVIFDGRNCLDPKKLHEAGLLYFPIGRGVPVNVSVEALTVA